MSWQDEDDRAVEYRRERDRENATHVSCDSCQAEVAIASAYKCERCEKLHCADCIAEDGFGDGKHACNWCFRSPAEFCASEGAA